MLLCLTCLRHQFHQHNRNPIQNNSYKLDLSHLIGTKKFKRTSVGIKIKKILLRKKNLRQKYCYLLKLARLRNGSFMIKLYHHFLKTPFCRRIIGKWLADKDRSTIDSIKADSYNISSSSFEQISPVVEDFCQRLQSLLLCQPKEFIDEMEQLDRGVMVVTDPTLNNQIDNRKIRLLGEVIRLNNIVPDVSINEMLHSLLTIDFIYGPIFDDSCSGYITMEIEPLPIFELESSDNLTWLTAPSVLSETSSILPWCAREVNQFEGDYDKLDYIYTTNESMYCDVPTYQSLENNENIADDDTYLNEYSLEDDNDIETEESLTDRIIKAKNEYYERRDSRIIEMIISLRERILYSNTLLTKVVNPLYGDKRLIKLIKDTFDEEYEIVTTFCNKVNIPEWQFGLFLEKHNIMNFKLTGSGYFYSIRTHYSNDLYKLIRIFGKMNGKIRLPYSKDETDYKITFPVSLNLMETQSKDKDMFEYRVKDLEMYL